MRYCFSAAGAAATLLMLPGHASACGIHPPPLALIHSALPNPLPTGVVIAAVAAEPDDSGAAHPYGMRVRVRRMVQGNASTVLLLRTGRTSSCFDAFGNGRIGYVIGIPAGRSEGIPVVAPILVHRQQGYRLPDGWQLPPPNSRGPPISDEDTVVVN